jgi:hypothetical protein
VATVTSGTQICQDSVTVTVNQPSANTLNQSIIEGQTFSFNGQQLTTAGTYTATLVNAAGCDSTVTLNLTVNPVPLECEVTASEATVCAGEDVGLQVSTSGGSVTSPTVPSLGLSAHYPFTGNANDASGGGNNGSVQGATLTSGQAGVANTAYQFNAAASNYIGLPQPFLGGGQVSTFTMHARVKANSIANSPNIWGKTLFWGEVNLLIANDGAVAMSWANSITGNKYSSIYTNPGVIQPGIWYDIVVVFGNSVGTIFVNGLALPTNLGWSAQGGALLSTTQIEATCNFAQDAGSSRIGVRNTGGAWGNYLDGILDEFSVWNRALTAAEVAALSGTAGPSVAWSTGATTPSITVAPTATTTYVATVTSGTQTARTA